LCPMQQPLLIFFTNVLVVGQSDEVQWSLHRSAFTV
jgi:hypothetical protein